MTDMIMFCSLSLVIYFSRLFTKMPKKKTGARKKAERQKLRQKDIRSGEKAKDITENPCNFVMVIESSVNFLFIFMQMHIIVSI